MIYKKFEDDFHLENCQNDALNIDISVSNNTEIPASVQIKLIIAFV